MNRPSKTSTPASPRRLSPALEDGVRPWVRPWNAEHAAGRISRPLRHNGQPYTGINILSLWTSASVQGFAVPIWMTYRQAVGLGAYVRKGEKGSPVVYADSITGANQLSAGWMQTAALPRNSPSFEKEYSAS